MSKVKVAMPAAPDRDSVPVHCNPVGPSVPPAPPPLASVSSSTTTATPTADADGERARRARDSWAESDINMSTDGDMQIHNQIKQGIMGFMENEIKKPDPTKNPITTLSAYVNSVTESDENILRHSKSSRSNAHRERKSPSKRRKKRASRHRSDLGSDFDITVSSLSALEKVDAYLKEYDRSEEVTLSGELEIDPNDLVNNNGSSKESKLKPRRTRRKSRHEDGKRERGLSSRDISPRVFDPSTCKQGRYSPGSKPVRPTLDLSSMLDDLGSDITSYNDRHIDNPFSSPSPMTSPNDGTLDRAFSSRSERIFVQRGGTFKAITRDRVLGDGQGRGDERKYFRLSSLTPLDIAISTQIGWRGVATLCHGLLGGLCLMHLLSICYGDGSSFGHLSFHSAIILPYTAAYYFLCACCLVSVLDSLDINSLSHSVNIQPQLKALILIFVYLICLLLTLSSRTYDEMMAFHFDSFTNMTQYDNHNATAHVPPEFYSTWSHLSVWRAVLPILASVFVVLARQEDLLYRDLTKLLQFKHSLQSIGG